MASINQKDQASDLTEKMASLPEKATSLSSLVQRLTTAKENTTKKKIFCVLRSLLFIAVIAGGILGCIATSATYPILFTVILFAMMIAMTALSMYSASRIGNSASSSMVLSFCGAFLPFLEDCWHLGRLNAKIEENQREITDSLTNITDFFNTHRVSLKEKAEELQNTMTQQATDRIKQSKPCLNINQQLRNNAILQYYLDLTEKESTI